jgi:hypothetical protein
MSDLEKIRARHSTVIDSVGETCQVCPWEHPPPCDVVRLAEALERARRVFASCHGYEAEARDCERTLHDVAGGDDE